MKEPVYSFPFDSPNNQYFPLWRAALHNEGISIQPPPRFELFSLLWAPRGIICVHWSTALYGSRFLFKSLAFLLANAFLLSVLKAIRRHRVVWIMHNARAHDYPYPTIDRIGRVLVAAFADAVVCQQETTTRTTTLAYPHKLVRFAPHGNYIGAYGPRAERASARRRFGFAATDIVVMSFGAIRPYRRIDEIISAFTLSSADSRVKLWIVGKGSPAEIARIRALAIGDTRVRIDPIFVPDEEVSAYLACADYAVFYYDDSELTSGALILALSYGVPVISRPIAGAYAVKEGESGFLFDNTEKLSEAFSQLAEMVAPNAEQVIRSIERDTWEEAAKRQAAIFRELLA